MKKLSLLFVSMLIIGIASAQNRQQLRYDRSEVRAERHAAYTAKIDSLVMAHRFEFHPQSYQMQPAGSMNMIYNPLYFIVVNPDYVQVYIPTLRGYVPPYYVKVLNYDIYTPQTYITVQENQGWRISFSFTDTEGYDYTYDFYINSVSGETTLNMVCPMFNTVTYTGFITSY